MSVGRRHRPRAGRTHQVSRYDLLLGLLPLPLLAGGGLSVVSSLTPAVGVGLGGVLSLTLLAYGLFYDPPTAAMQQATPQQATPQTRRRSD